MKIHQIVKKRERKLLWFLWQCQYAFPSIIIIPLVFLIVSQSNISVLQGIFMLILSVAVFVYTTLFLMGKFPKLNFVCMNKFDDKISFFVKYKDEFVKALIWTGVGVAITSIGKWFV